MGTKDAERMANSIVPPVGSSLIWVYTVCPDLSCENLEHCDMSVMQLYFVLLNFRSAQTSGLCSKCYKGKISFNPFMPTGLGQFHCCVLDKSMFHLRCILLFLFHLLQ